MKKTDGAAHSGQMSHKKEVEESKGLATTTTPGKIRYILER